MGARIAQLLSGDARFSQPLAGRRRVEVSWHLSKTASGGSDLQPYSFGLTPPAHVQLDAPSEYAYAITYVYDQQVMTTVTATEARKQLYKLLDDVSDSHEPVQITGKRGNAVLVGEDDWRAVQETLYLVSIPGMRESVIAGMATPVEELDGELRW